MDDFTSTLLITVIAYIIEFLKIQFNLSFINIIIFINLLGMYYIVRKIRFNITIEYNNNI
jgi:hypothetical protein